LQEKSTQFLVFLCNSSSDKTHIEYGKYGKTTFGNIWQRLHVGQHLAL